MVEEIDLSGVTYYSDNVYGSPVYVSDGNLATSCQQMSYIAIDFGSGNSETISQIKIAVHNTTAQTAITGATPYFQGSNDTTNGVDGNWTNLVQITSVNFGTPDSYPGFGDVIEFVNTTAYRWHKLAGTTRSPSTVVNEWILFYGEPPWDGKIDTPEMITTTSTVSDIQLQLDSPESLVTTSADSSLFVGVPIITPEMLVTTSAESDLQLNIDSAESVVTTGADSDIQLQLDSPEALVTTASLSGIFTGVPIVTPEIIVTTGGESDLQLQLDSPEALVTTEGAGDIQLQLVGPGIIVTTGVSDTSITATLPVIFVSDTDTINITGHGETDGNIVVFDTINTTTGITKNTDYYVINATTDTFQIAATEGGAAIELTNKGSGTIFTYEIITFEIREATLRFYLLVSAGLDGRYDNIEDMEIPISSFQAKRRDGSTTFLETVVPDYNYLEEIIIRNEYDTSSIKIKQGYEKNGVILQKDIIIETNIDRLDYDISVKNSPIMLSGHGYTVNGEYTLKRPSGGVSGTITSLPGYFPASGQHLYKAVNIDIKGRDNVILKRMRNGLLYFRLVQPDLTLNPGDSVTIGDDTFIIGLMRFAISAELENLFEISEAS